MTGRWLGRASVVCLALSGGMLFLSLFCLCVAGQMVDYFLVAVDRQFIERLEAQPSTAPADAGAATSLVR